jgi:hypothetical protein
MGWPLARGGQRRSRSWVTLALAVLGWATPVRGQLAGERGAEEVGSSRSFLLQGFVETADGVPAEGALVLTSAGGQALVGPRGEFQLRLELAHEANVLQVTAARTSQGRTLVGSARVALGRVSPVLSVGTITLSSTAGCQPSWLPTFGAHTDLRGVIHALAVFDDGRGTALYAGGAFPGRVARLEGDRWVLLSDIDGLVYAMAVFDDGSGPALYVGGDFDTVSGTFVRSLARWNGRTWTPVGSVVGGGRPRITSLLVHDDQRGRGPALYIGGDFALLPDGTPSRNIGRWDKHGWTALGRDDDGAGISDLAAFDDGLGGGPQLYALESLVLGGALRPRIQRWDGTSWSLLTDDFTLGVKGFARDLEVFEDPRPSSPLPARKALYVGGAFTHVAGVEADQVARWDGRSWSAVAGGPGFDVTELATVEEAGDRALYACGAGQVRRFDGQSWASLPAMLTGADVLALARFDDGSGPALYTGSSHGGFNDAECFASKWDGVCWSTIGSWLNSPVLSLAVFDDGLGGGPALYAGGLFSVTGGIAARAVAKWDGSTWSDLNGGVEGTFRTSVNALAVHDDGRGPALFAAGEFARAGGRSVANVARWDGRGWSSLGAGLNNAVHALAVHDDGLGGGAALYAAGLFSHSGSVPAGRIARWDGASWSALGSGLSETAFALESHDEGFGAGPALFVGGRFTSAGGVSAARIARWDGASWSALGTGVNNVVECLRSFDDGQGLGPALYAGGQFTSAGGRPAARIARWDGTSWSALGRGLNSNAQALEVFDDGRGPALYVGGAFTAAGGAAAGSLARWDGANWEPVGSGVQDPSSFSVRSLRGAALGSAAPALFAGGTFLSIGGTGDSYLGRWQTCPLARSSIPRKQRRSPSAPMVP